AIAEGRGRSALAASLRARHLECETPCPEMLDALRVPCIAERALVYLYAEQNLLSAEQLRGAVRQLGLDREYLGRRLSDNRRPLEL
ncbi:MAG TPA: thymidine kinase, partial [Rectinemataceae bacterium]|nr:thymidine kinase [Rectinemataceae bacterium]